jgi:hypothetical protein
MLIKPLFSAKTVSQYPIEAFVSVPQEVRKFCCFVGVEYWKSKKIVCGSGALTTLGILTALHLIDKEEKPDLIHASFILSDYEYFNFELKDPIAFPELDLAIFEAPEILFDFYEPASVIVDSPDLVKEILKKEKIYSFGCPNGVLGLVWEVKPLAFHKGRVYSKGVAYSGISGGPLFYFKNEHPIVFAINFSIYTGSGTIVSQTFELNLKKGVMKDERNS